MDEFTSIAIWLLIVIMSINSAVIYLDATPTFHDNGLGLGITTDTYFSDYSFSIDSNNSNTITTTQRTTSQGSSSDVTTSGNKITNTMGVVLFAWTSILNAVLLGVPGGQFFIWILLPIVGFAQIVAMFIIGLRIFSAIRGLF